MNNEQLMDNLGGGSHNLTSTAPERIWLYGFPRTDGGQDVNYHERPKWMPSEPAATPSVPYIRADLAPQLGDKAPQWKPIEDMPEELKDGRKVLLIDMLSLAPSHSRGMFRYKKDSALTGSWMDGNHWIPFPTHYFDFGTVALPIAPQAEAEEGE